MIARAPLLAILAVLLAPSALAADPPHAPLPARKPGSEAPKPAESDKPGETPKAAEQSPAALAPQGDWRVGPVNALDGSFAYCVAESHFTSGHGLIIARNTPGELNIAVAIPGAQLPLDQRWDVKVQVDETTRDKVAVAMQPDLLVVPQGKDEELFTLLQRGKQLAVVSATDRVAFQLKGSGKALADLKTCAEKAVAAPPRGAARDAPKEAGKEAGKMPFPDALGEILAQAGLREVKPVSFADMPEDKRPADFAWRVGRVFGGVRERTVGADATLAALSDEYVDALKAKCPGKPNATLGAAETLQDVEIRTGTVDCEAGADSVHVALTFYLTASRLFTTFFHEGPVTDAAVSDRARDNITAVIRRLAGAPPPRP